MGGLSKRLAASSEALTAATRNASVRRVALAYAGSAMGLYANSVAIAVFAFRNDGATAVGFVLAARLGVAAAVAPFAAGLADRFRQERVMLVSDLARVVTVSVCAVVAFTDAPSLVLYVFATLTSVFGAVFRPAEASLLPRIARTPEELTAANVASSTFDSVGSFIGPALGAILLAVAGTGAVFVGVACTFAWSAFMVAGIRRVPTEPGLVDDPPEEEDTGGLAAGFRTIGAEPRLRLLMGLYGAQCLVAGALGVLLVVTALELLGLGNAGVGLLEAACGVGAIAGAGVALALVGRRRVAGDLAVGIVLWGAPLVAIGVLPRTWLAVLALGVVGLGNSLVDISGMTLLQRTAPPAVAARVFGVLETVTIGAMALGSVLTPLFVHLLGVRGTLIVAGAFLPVIALLFARQLRAIDEGARVPSEQLDALRGVPFLTGLPLRPLETLAAALTPIELAPDAVLFRRGDHGDRYYVLTGGTLAIDLPEGTKEEHAPGGVGEIALMRDVPRTATVRAVGEVSLWALDRDVFLEAVTGHARTRGAAEALVVSRAGIGTSV